MIQEICNEIDNCLEKCLRENRLFELIVSVLRDADHLPKDFIEMCYEIHEIDSFSGETEEIAKKSNLQSPTWFFEQLREIKFKNIKYWNLHKLY